MSGNKTEKSFININEYVYLLKVPYEQTEVGIVLVKGVGSNVLIDTGANDEAIDVYLSHALSELGMTIYDIDVAAITHCHIDNIGGLKRLIELNPNIRVAANPKNADRLRNPMKYLIERRSLFPTDEHPFKEVRGVFTNRLITLETPLRGFKLIYTPGHTADSVCYYHKMSKTLICGDSFQGNGNKYQGIASIEDYEEYIKTLERFEVHADEIDIEDTDPSKLDIKYIVCSHDMDDMEFFETLRSPCEKAVDEEKTREILDITRRCSSIIREYSEKVDKLIVRECRANIAKYFDKIGKKTINKVIAEHNKILAISKRCSDKIGKTLKGLLKSNEELEEADKIIPDEALIEILRVLKPKGYCGKIDDILRISETEAYSDKIVATMKALKPEAYFDKISEMIAGKCSEKPEEYSAAKTDKAIISKLLREMLNGFNKPDTDRTVIDKIISVILKALKPREYSDADKMLKALKPEEYSDTEAVLGALKLEGESDIEAILQIDKCTDKTDEITDLDKIIIEKAMYKVAEEIFKAIMTAEYITPLLLSECEKSPVCYPIDSQLTVKSLLSKKSF